MARKVQVVRDKRYCYWFGDFITALQSRGFQETGRVPSCGIALGWLPADRIEEVRSLPEVASISDDYSTLVQEDT
jgi:hypothetical protein